MIAWRDDKLCLLKPSFSSPWKMCQFSGDVAASLGIVGLQQVVPIFIATNINLSKIGTYL
jgi:hypothetical protein